jgi:hypothetical protein
MRYISNTMALLIVLGLLAYTYAALTGCASSPPNPCKKICDAAGYPVSGFFNGDCTCYRHTEDVWSR